MKSTSLWGTLILNSARPMSFASMSEFFVLMFTMHIALHNTHRMKHIKQEKARQSLKFSEPQVKALHHWADLVKIFFGELPNVPSLLASIRWNWVAGRELQNQAHSGPIGF